MMANSRILRDYSYFSLISIILVLFGTINSTKSHRANNDLISGAKGSASDYILCRLCGADLADSQHIFNYLSPEAEVVVNQTVFDKKGVEVQLLRNPVGIQFHIITLSNSKCAPVHEWQYDFSWYPGYAWKPCICKQCRLQHGWIFEPLETANLSFHLPSYKGFFALKLYNLQSENFVNSLIVVPKSYLN